MPCTKKAFISGLLLTAGITLALVFAFLNQHSEGFNDATNPTVNDTFKAVSIGSGVVASISGVVLMGSAVGEYQKGRLDKKYTCLIFVGILLALFITGLTANRLFADVGESKFGALLSACAGFSLVAFVFTPFYVCDERLNNNIKLRGLQQTVDASKPKGKSNQPPRVRNDTACKSILVDDSSSTAGICVSSSEATSNSTRSTSSESSTESDSTSGTSTGSSRSSTCTSDSRSSSYSRNSISRATSRATTVTERGSEVRMAQCWRNIKNHNGKSTRNEISNTYDSSNNSDKTLADFYLNPVSKLESSDDSITSVDPDMDKCFQQTAAAAEADSYGSTISDFSTLSAPFSDTPTVNTSNGPAMCLEPKADAHRRLGVLIQLENEIHAQS